MDEKAMEAETDTTKKKKEEEGEGEQVEEVFQEWYHLLYSDEIDSDVIHER